MFSNEPDFQTYDYAIGGKLIVAHATLDENFSQLMNTDHEARMEVKRKLINDMAEYILENKLVEFTQQKEPIMFQTRIAVRAYMAPDSTVRLLRLANKIL
jgi:hypothetical protein